MSPIVSTGQKLAAEMEALEGQRADENFWLSEKQTPGLVQRRQPRMKLRWAAIDASGKDEIGGRTKLGKAINRVDQSHSGRSQQAYLQYG